MLERLFLIRYMFGSKKSSMVRTMGLLSIGGIGIGVLAMVVVLSVMGGFDEAIKTRLLGIEPHALVQADNGTAPLPAMREAVTTLVAGRGDVHEYSKQDVVVRTVDGIFSGAVAQGEESSFMNSLLKRVKHSVSVTESATGAVATAKNESEVLDVNLGPKEVCLGIDLARSLGIFEGDEITVVAPESLLLPAGELPIYEKVKVRALVRTDVPDIDSHAVFFDVKNGLRKLRETASLERGLEIRLKNPDEAPRLGEKLRALKIGKVQTWQDLNAALFYSLKMEKALMGLFLALTILVSSFSIVAVLVLLVSEKRADVGILKALGATKNKIRSIFMTIGLVLGLVGIFGGTILGLVICWILKTYPIIKLPDIYYDTSVPVHVDYNMVLGVVVFGALLALGGTIIPAWRISRYEPINAIRHDDGA